MDRAIVIHSASYVSQEYISKFGVIGRSWGCPVVEIDKIDKVIEEVENGYCLFIYTNDSSYLKESKIINE